MINDTIINLVDVSFSYLKHEMQLSHINLQIKQGSCILITGASGSGKTTLTRLINGLIPHYYEGDLQGDIFISGKNAKSFASWEYGMLVGSIFQDTRSQFFTSTVIDEIAFPAENYGKNPISIMERADKVLQANQIIHLKDQKLLNISSGEKQKVAMVAAQVHDPDIYVLDEPSANLDNRSAWMLLEMIRDLKSQNKTIVIADHRFFFLADIVDEVIYMKQGKISERWNHAEFSQMKAETLDYYGLRSNKHTELDIAKLNEYGRTIEKPYFSAIDLAISPNRFSKSLLQNLNFEFHKGEIIAIIGDNGVGKTTLAKTICGLIPELKGEIKIDSITTKAKKRLKRTWFVLQETDCQLFSDSVMNELLLGTAQTASHQEEATRLLKELNLWEFKDQHPATLSGGQKQRLTFAVGLMRKPEILILDEPTSGLDASNMKQIVQLIKEESQKGILILVISHDYEFIQASCDRVIYIGSKNDDGQVSYN